MNNLSDVEIIDMDKHYFYKKLCEHESQNIKLYNCAQNKNDEQLEILVEFYQEEWFDIMSHHNDCYDWSLFQIFCPEKY